MTEKNYSKGFIALMSVLVISAVILAITVTAGASSFHARSNALQNEFKRQALSLAEACVNVALLNLRENYYYNPTDDMINVGSDACYIASVSSPDANFNRQIRTWAEVNGSFSSVLTDAVVFDPTLPPLPPPAACSLLASPDSIDAGGSAWLSWSTTTNADSFSITSSVDGSVISTTPGASGQTLVTPTVTTTYRGEVRGPGGVGECSASVEVGRPPDCADFFIMLDRTNNMAAVDLANEKAAAKGVLRLFASTTDPRPQVGIGRYGDNTNGSPEAEIVPGVSSHTGFRNPTAEQALAGGDGNGFEVEPMNAFVDGESSAQNINGSGDKHMYYNYGINIPPNTTVTGVEVRLDWWLPHNIDSNVTDGENSITVELSWDGGTSWVSKISNDESVSPANTDTLGGSLDTWGRSWGPSHFSNGNFRVRLTMNCTGAASCPNRDFRLDWVAVRIHHTQPPIGWLSSSYGDDDPGNDNDGDLFNAIEEAAVSNSTVGANLADAIAVGAAELNGPRHLADKRKVLLLVSDGDPSEPASAMEAALDVADSAKLEGIEIFTVFFGSDPSGFAGRELLAALASGPTSALALPSHAHSGATHQAGSSDNFNNNASGYTSENNDSDNFFIARTSADFTSIFESVGRIACPALGVSANSIPPSPPPPPSTPQSNISIGSWHEI